ncbi:hypothetical protein L209DRAFT_86180 [Thermothelomyces heterothallicus CBS 203.75]
MSLATAAPAQGRGAIPALAESSDPQRDPGATSGDAQRELEKKKRRSLFGFGKKKTTEAPAKAAPPSSKPPPPATGRTTAASPVRTDHPPLSPSSPGRPGFASSPRLASPAGSQIFERDVQESAISLIPSSPAIPSHIRTENHVPPVLDASSEAITDDHLNPDSVEIITHTSHQPAALAVTGGLGPYPAAAPTEASWADELAAFSASDNNTNPAAAAAAAPATAETASNYGSFDTTDVRRLSFISFADVVLAEQSQNERFFGAGGGSPSRESTYLAGLSSFPHAAASASAGANHPRSASPIRSPVSSSGTGRPGSVSPPTSKSGSVQGFDLSAAAAAAAAARVRGSSPAGRAPSSLGSPTSLLSMQLSSPGAGGGTVNGEIAIETMTQALRRTGSGDMSIGSGGGLRSFPASPTI